MNVTSFSQPAGEADGGLAESGKIPFAGSFWLAELGSAHLSQSEAPLWSPREGNSMYYDDGLLQPLLLGIRLLQIPLQGPDLILRAGRDI